MPAFVTFGRILFAVLFIYTGATKLFAIQATADFIATKVVVPDVIAPYAKQVETATAMTTPQLLAIALGGLEIIAGLMIALEFRRALLCDADDHLRRGLDRPVLRFLESGGARQRQDAGRRAEESCRSSARCS